MRFVLIIVYICMSSLLKSSAFQSTLVKGLKPFRLTRQLSSSSPTLQSAEEVWPHRFSIAPMMEYTNTHQRYFQRLITKKAMLYTEMVTANAITRSDKVEKFLQSTFDIENPLVLQIGGSSAQMMADATKIIVDYGYKEININCGCPSPKVAGAGCFGASLMLDEKLVVEMAQLMSAVSSNVPITIKCRIGVDEHDSYEELVAFIGLISTQANVKHFIIHSRKALLDLSPDKNRNIPPLDYTVVYRLVKDFPNLDFTLNGGVTTYSEVLEHYANGVKGVMVGRAAIENSYYWRNIDSKLYNTTDPGLSRREILEQYGEYCDKQLSINPKGRIALWRPVHHLFARTKEVKEYRRQLDLYCRKEESLSKAFQLAVKQIPAAVLDYK